MMFFYPKPNFVIASVSLLRSPFPLPAHIHKWHKDTKKYLSRPARGAAGRECAGGRQAEASHQEAAAAQGEGDPGVGRDAVIGARRSGRRERRRGCRRGGRRGGHGASPRFGGVRACDVGGERRAGGAG